MINYNLFWNRLVCLLFVFLVSACRNRLPHVDYTFSVFISDHEENSFTEEREWLEHILTDSLEVSMPDIRFDSSADKNSADIFIDFFSYWEFENRIEGVQLSKTYFVPKENPLDSRKNTSLESCINGSENLVRLDELAPPFVALKVDGYCVDDGAYPLILYTGITVKFREDEKDYEKRKEKTDSLAEFLSGLSKPFTEENPAITWISSAGDIMLGRNAGNILLRDGPTALLGGVYDIFTASDLVLVNLEGALSSRGTQARKTFTFRFEPPQDLAFSIKNAGIHAVLFVNNHSFDYGETAFLDSISFLEEAGIGVIGAGRNLEEVRRGWAFEKNGFSARVWGIGSFPQESSGWDGLEHIAEDNKAGFIHARRGGAEIVCGQLQQSNEENYLNMVLFHGGEEWSERPNRQTRELYTILAQSGADLIIGSHPHIVQGFEWIEDKLIFWSLGNFVFAGMEDTGGGDEGLLIHLGYLGKKLVYMEVFALSLQGPRVVIAPEERLEGFYRKSRELALSASPNR